MKFKIITLVYILILGSFSFSDELFLTGGLSSSFDAGINGFDSREVKIQPELKSDAFFFVNFGRSFKIGLYSGLLYAFSSNLDGGWSYPGFSGIETGIEFRYTLPFLDSLDIGTGAAAGWYRYNLTENFFFLPSVEIYPALRIIENSSLDFYMELPVKFFFHRQADIFMSAGIKGRIVFK